MLDKGTMDLIAQIVSDVKEIQDMEAMPIKIVRKDGRVVGRERNGIFAPLEDMNEQDDS